MQSLIAMASLTIRGLDPALKERLRVQAARNGRDGGRARVILREALAKKSDAPRRLGTWIHREWKERGGVDLDLPPRAPAEREPG